LRNFSKKISLRIRTNRALDGFLKKKLKKTIDENEKIYNVFIPLFERFERNAITIGKKIFFLKKVVDEFEKIDKLFVPFEGMELRRWT
jgi:hypothetical protein